LNQDPIGEVVFVDRRMTRLSELIRGESKHSLSMPRWLERLASVGIVTANPEIARRQRITNIGAFVAGGTTLAHLVINAVHDPGGLVVVHIFNAAFALLALLTPTLHRYGENAAAIGLAALVLLGTVVIVWLLGTASHLQIYFMPIGALLLFVGMQNSNGRGATPTRIFCCRPAHRPEQTKSSSATVPMIAK
jgi:adenylate cyclase